MEGYLIMDIILVFVFGIIVVNVICFKGVNDCKFIVIVIVKVGFIVVIGFVFVYGVFGWFGVISVLFGYVKNGG